MIGFVWIWVKLIKRFCTCFLQYKEKDFHDIDRHFFASQYLKSSISVDNWTPFFQSLYFPSSIYRWEIKTVISNHNCWAWTCCSLGETFFKGEIRKMEITTLEEYRRTEAGQGIIGGHRPQKSQPRFEDCKMLLTGLLTGNCILNKLGS